VDHGVLAGVVQTEDQTWALDPTSCKSFFFAIKGHSFIVQKNIHDALGGLHGNVHFQLVQSTQAWAASKKPVLVSQITAVAAASTDEHTQ
jgi:hypothetical protein